MTSNYNDLEVDIDLLSPHSRLAAAMKGKNQAWLAKQVDVATSTINGYLKGKMPPVDVAFKICKALDIDIHWYVEGKEMAVSSVSSDGVTNIPMIDNVQHALQFPNSLISAFGVDVNSLCCLNVSGTLMSPGIPKGAEVLATKSFGEIQDGRVYILKIKDSIVLRRVQVRTDGKIVAFCDNPLVQHEVPDAIKTNDIIAMALWSGYPL